MQQIKEQRLHPRFGKILTAEIVELPRGAKLHARTSDLSHGGCYIDTLNAIPGGSRVLVRLTHRDEIFEAIGRVVYVSRGLGMGICFTEVEAAQENVLERWLAETGEEF